MDYFAYYDEGIVVPVRQGKGRGEPLPAAADSEKKEEEGESGKETEKRDSDVNQNSGSQVYLSVCHIQFSFLITCSRPHTQVVQVLTRIIPLAWAGKSC